MNETPIRVLLVEDNPNDARLIRAMLADAPTANQIAPPFEVEWVQQLAAALAGLPTGFQAVLLDLALPDSRGLDTFVRLHNHAPRLPIIVLTGLDDAAVAVQAVRQGAQDYLVKDQTSAPLLARSIRYAIERNQAEQEREQLIAELQAALAQVKLLSGLLPICAACKKIRDDQGYWNQLEVYIAEHSQAEFTHSICPDCARKLYPDCYVSQDDPPA